MLADERDTEWYGARGEVEQPRLTKHSSRIPTKLLAHVDAAALAATIQAFAISRLLLALVTYLAMAFHPSVWGYHHASSSTFWDAWYQWDSRWYVRVARVGYEWHDPQHWSSVAFFPFYPALIWVLVTVIPVSAKLGAIIVSNAAFFGALFFLFRLVRREFGDEIAGRTIWYLSIFPTALFFFAGYSESPFLLWTVLSVSAMRQRQWAMAGLWGFFAAATRSQGLLLVVPFAVEVVQVYGRRWWQQWRSLWVVLIPGGAAVLALIMQALFANPMAFIESQRAWHRTLALPWDGVLLSINKIPLNKIAFPRPAHNLIELCAVALFVALIVVGWRRVPLSFSLYSTFSMLLMLMNPAILDNYYLPLMSSSRLCLALFPCFITLAIIGRNRAIDRLVTTLGPGLLAVFTIVFLQGAWVA
jgi:Gpi18-like mannosyltransferase